MVAGLGSSRKIPSSDGVTVLLSMACVEDIPDVSVTIGSELVVSGAGDGLVVTSNIIGS